MGQSPRVPESGTPTGWRVVVFTVLPAQLVYGVLEETLRPLGHRIVGVVTSPGPTRRRSASYLDLIADIPPGVDILVSNHPARWAAMLAPLRPDLIVGGGFPWRIPPEVLALPRLGAINLHPSLLPKDRGPNSIGWAFRRGDAEMGFTVHRLAPGFDTGPILAQGRVPIADDDDADALGVKLGALIPGLVRAALARVARGEPGEEQDEGEATYAGLFEDEWRTLDWSAPARAVHNRVRSWTGIRDIAKGALGDVEGETLQITRTRLLAPAPGGTAAPEAAPSGTVLRREGGRLVVQCGDGPLEVVAWTRPADAPGAAPSTPQEGA